jgi:hypothetical protein
LEKKEIRSETDEGTDGPEESDPEISVAVAGGARHHTMIPEDTTTTCMERRWVDETSTPSRRGGLVLYNDTVATLLDDRSDSSRSEFSRHLVHLERFKEQAMTHSYLNKE